MRYSLLLEYNEAIHRPVIMFYFKNVEEWYVMNIPVRFLTLTNSSTKETKFQAVNLTCFKYICKIAATTEN